MKLFYVIYVFALIISIIAMMSMMLAWAKETDPKKKDKWQKAWHGFSWIFRVAAYVLLIVTLHEEWMTILLLTPLVETFCWTLWDGSINLHLHKDWWYVGFTAKWDKLWNRKKSMIVKIIIAIISAGCLIYLIVI